MDKKILIIEDEKSTTKSLEMKLKNSGLSAKVVFNGEEVLEELKKEQYIFTFIFNGYKRMIVLIILIEM